MFQIQLMVWAILPSSCRLIDGMKEDWPVRLNVARLRPGLCRKLLPTNSAHKVFPHTQGCMRYCCWEHFTVDYVLAVTVRLRLLAWSHGHSASGNLHVCMLPMRISQQQKQTVKSVYSYIALTPSALTEAAGQFAPTSYLPQ